MIRGGVDTAGKLRAELSRLKSLNPFQVLDLAPESATGASVRAAFLSATKKYHPNRYARDSLEMRDLATEVFLVIRRAYAQLGDESKLRSWRERLGTSDARTPPPEPVTLPPPAARERPARASQVPPTVPPSGPPPRPPASLTGRSADEVRALLDEARTRGIRFEQANKLMEEAAYTEARAVMQKLAAEDPQSRKYRVRLHHAWGLEHMASGRFDDAVRELERAASLDSESGEVARALAKARQQRDAPRGVFSRWFGR